VDEVRFYYNVAMSGETIAALGKGDRKGWELDGIGNWTGYTANGTAQNRTHNLGNELTKINGSAAHVQHDGAGNMTWAPKVGSEGTAHWTVTWDAWNRPATVKSGTTLTAEYRYDGEGRRIAKLRPNGSNWRRTDYYYDGEWRVVEERHAESQADKEALPALVKCQYVWDARYLDACAVRWRDGNNDGDFLDANEMLYYTHDAHFNVTALVNASGTVQERYAYEAYGRATICDGRWVTRSSSSYDNQVSFSGYRWDPETALYHVRHRTYHPTLGRWVSRDPIGERGGVNLYNFVFNDPAGTIDLTGLAVWLHLGPGNTAEKAAHFDQVKTRIDTIRTALLANAALHKDDKNWTFYFDGEKKDYFTFKTLCEREKLETKMTSAESPEGDAKEVQTTFGKHEYPYDVTFYWYHSYAELAGDPKVPEPQWIYMVPYVKKQGADRVVNRVENDTVEKGLFPHECG
jgi:RHS repeat-associated protein